MYTVHVGSVIVLQIVSSRTNFPCFQQMSISTLTKHISLRKLRKLNSLAKLYVFNKKKEISIFSFSKASQNKYQNDASQSCLLWKLLRANNKLSLKPLIGTIHFLFSPKIPPKPFCDPRIFQDFLDNINIDYFFSKSLIMISELYHRLFKNFTNFMIERFAYSVYNVVSQKSWILWVVLH